MFIHQQHIHMKDENYLDSTFL